MAQFCKKFLWQFVNSVLVQSQRLQCCQVIKAVILETDDFVVIEGSEKKQSKWQCLNFEVEESLYHNTILPFSWTGTNFYETRHNSFRQPLTAFKIKELGEIGYSLFLWSRGNEARPVRQKCFFPLIGQIKLLIWVYQSCHRKIKRGNHM